MRFHLTAILIIILTVFTIEVHSQRLMEKGDEALSMNHYYEAVTYYSSQLEKRGNDSLTIATANYGIAYCFLKLSLPEKAEMHWEEAIKYKYPDAMVHYYYAQTLQMLQKYYEALLEYRHFKKIDPENELAEKGMQSINYSFEMLNEPTRYEVSIVRGLSSPESDYSPFFEQRNYRTVYFTSTRQTELHEVENPESGDYNSNIFYSELGNNGRWSRPQLVPGRINTENEEGAASLNFRSNNLYFTRCAYDRHSDKGCRIFMAQKTGRFWGRVVKVEIPGIPDHLSIGHPAISHDELTLYFSAEGLHDGKGGKDLYKTTRNRRNEEFGPPVNLGPQINTEGDEMYPYIRPNGDLYFSSNGHPGMGGLDIYLAKLNNNNEYEIINLGSPINSSHDDFGIVFMGNKEEGFLSSRRSRGMGKIDIYHFVLPELEFSVSGTIFDNMTLEKLKNVEINVMDDNYKLIKTVRSDRHGQYFFNLEKDNNFVVQYKSEEYKTEKIKISTMNLTDSKFFTRDIFLNK